MTGISSGFVALIGIGTVFISLVLIIVLCTIMSALCRAFVGNKKPVAAPAASSAPAAMPNRQEFIAAVSAVLAEEMGTDVSGIRILSVKKI